MRSSLTGRSRAVDLAAQLPARRHQPASSAAKNTEPANSEPSIVGGTELFEMQDAGSGTIAAPAPPAPVRRAGPTLGAGPR